MRAAYVFFLAPKAVGRRAKFFMWCIRTVSRSRITHCSVGTWLEEWGGHVLENMFGEVNGSSVGYFAFRRYILHYPGLVCYFEVPLAVDPQLSSVEGLGPKHSWDVFWWWLSRGKTKCRTSCVAIVTDRLRCGGLDVPDFVTPQQLHDWLKGRGYVCESLE